MTTERAGVAGHGATTVTDRAFTKIATEVAADDDRLAERPRVTASVSGAVAAVRLGLAVRYPASVPQVAADVRERLRSRVHALTGITVENVDIDIVRLVPGPRSGHDDSPTA
ncbi:Asp23/Gls24 family envelope stress response protein [Microtetraspora sp. AC03309]|uniref:Asp23/Gls24 family envelope stress response protein n=1 Tax=Microtetraspora sp. AC03309 TaxID=2779376 RepID=UPI001E2EB8FE|nr:Asp23/Gls24 family envelope stress response protein [Microtetraspora sp. AC03309]MCC5579748.1 Asp23/Gls24 family envelope stress response protein [Microtetraspora sp. AC03309]